MKNKLLLLLLVSLLMPIGAWAALVVGDTFTANGMTFKVTNLNPYEVQVGNNTACVNKDTTGVITIPQKVMDSEWNVYVVKKIGDRAFSFCQNITKVDIPDSVTTIGDYAFYLCENLSNIIIPNSITTIQNYAFYKCTSLSSIVIPNSVVEIGIESFADTGLTSIYVDSGNPLFDSRNGCNAIIKTATNELIIGCQSTKIPNTVKCIGKYAFYSCKALTSITIPNSVDSICSGAFLGSGLTEVSIPNSVNYIESNIFNGTPWYEGLPDGLIYKDNVLLGHKGVAVEADLVITPGTRMIAANAFTGLTVLTSVTIPENVTICYRAFDSCVNLVSVTCGSDIGKEAFIHCDKLEKVTFLEGMTCIGDKAFYNVSSIKNITFPSTITSIGEYAFWKCTGLTSLSIPSGVTHWGINVFRDCTGLTEVICFSNPGNNAFLKCTNLSKLTLGDGVTNVGDFAFQNCGLEDVSLPNTLNNIGKYAFSLCHELKNITIPSSVDSIGELAFRECTNLKDVSLGQGIKVIGDRAFENCTSLQSITIPSSVISINDHVFDDCDALTAVYVADLDWWCKHNFGELYNVLYINGQKATEITDLVIPESITTLKKNAFRKWENLKSVTIPTSLTSIESGNFWGCGLFNAVHVKDIAKWCSINFLSNPLSYAKHLFMNGQEVKDLVIPEGVTAICKSAFSGGENLTSIAIPSSLKKIGSNAFSGCTGLNAVHIKNIATWCGFEFDSYLDNPLSQAHHLFMNGQEVKDLVIPEGVSSISKFAFYGCEGMTSIHIPTTLKSISDLAFNGCYGLTAVHIKDIAAWCGIEFGSNPLSTAQRLFMNGQEVTNLVIPEGVTTIRERAFQNCSSFVSVIVGNTVTDIEARAFNRSSLKTVTLGSSVVNIIDFAFYDCPYLNTVNSLIKKPQIISNTAFGHTDQETNTICTEPVGMTLYVPYGTKGRYENTSGWKVFKNIVEMVNIEPIDGETTLTMEGMGNEDLSDNVVNDVYYNVGEDGYDQTDGSIVIGQTTNMGQITNPVPGSEDVRQNFTGIILKVGAGKGTITLNAKTVGNAQLVVQIGNDTPMIASQTEQGEVVINYDVAEDTYVYIYAIIGSSTARMTRVATTDEVRIYSITVTPDASGISDITHDETVNPRYYTLDGKPLEKLQKGLNIVVMQDGTTKKVVVK